MTSTAPIAAMLTLRFPRLAKSAFAIVMNKRAGKSTQ
ncbi:Uncharacterised protein [Mycobacterium tuberculosis]|nr:Uncharacterised protein [Mycobacterium tuberculosis]